MSWKCRARLTCRVTLYLALSTFLTTSKFFSWEALQVSPSVIWGEKHLVQGPGAYLDHLVGCPYRGPGSRLSILLRGSSRNILAPSGGFGQGFFCHWAKKGLFMLFCLDLGIFFVFSSKKQFKSLEKSKKSREKNKYLYFRKTKQIIKCHNSIKTN